jgi:hypothetical protein
LQSGTALLVVAPTLLVLYHEYMTRVFFSALLALSATSIACSSAGPNQGEAGSSSGAGVTTTAGAPAVGGGHAGAGEANAGEAGLVDSGGSAGAAGSLGVAGSSGAAGSLGAAGSTGAAGAGGMAHPVNFEKIQLNPDFYSEGINYGDLNHDGTPDIIAGAFWYPGPSYADKLAFREPAAMPFDKGGDSDCYAIFPYDLNGDGWQDVLSFRQLGGAEAVWYENPKGASGYWKEHVVFESVNDESPAFVDMDGDGKPELVTVSNGYGGWAVPDWSHPENPWSFRNITANGGWMSFTHGLGASDVNGDGRKDLLLSEGWWEQPAVLSDAPWVKHDAKFWAQEDTQETYGGAQMFAYDVDGDGDNDVVTSLQAHAWGLAWFENQGGNFVEHMIVDNRDDEAEYGGVAFAQLHALAIGDIDGDGLTDFVTGKRKGAHGNGLGAELDEPAVLYWFKLVRETGKLPHFEPHLIDSEAGIGTQVIIADIDGNGFPDILTAARAGAFVFWNGR